MGIITNLEQNWYSTLVYEGTIYRIFYAERQRRNAERRNASLEATTHFHYCFCHTAGVPQSMLMVLLTPQRCTHLCLLPQKCLYSFQFSI